MTHSSLTVLVLLSCAISNTSWSPFTMVRATWIGSPESHFADRMRLFKHVLRNDDRWSLVLKQLVKLPKLNLPQYRVPKQYEDSLKELRLVAENVHEVMALDVIKDLMDKTPWSGTNVNYTAIVLSTAVTCFTYTNILYVLSHLDKVSKTAVPLMKLVQNKGEDKTGEYDIGDALDDVRMAFVVFIDKVAAVDGELLLLTSGLYDYDGSMYVKDSKMKINDDLFQLIVFKTMEDTVVEKIGQYCHRIQDAEIYQYLVEYGNMNTTSFSIDNFLPFDVKLKQDLAEFKNVVNSMLDVYDGLNVEAMSMETWIQILDYKVPITENVKFYIDDQLKVPCRQTESWSKRLKHAILQANEREINKKDPLQNIKKKRKRSRKGGRRRKHNGN